jgi:hypothetical protein
MGHLDIDVHIFAPDIESEIKQLLDSLSLGLLLSHKEQVHLVFVAPDVPESYVNSLELPEWGNPICKSLYRIAKAISQGAYADNLNLLELTKTVKFESRDWFSPELKAFFYHQNNQLLCFIFIAEREQNHEILLSRISSSIYFLATYWYASNNGLLLHSAIVAKNDVGFLFLGEGGAGKSTAAALSASTGAAVLSDDLSFVVSSGSGNYELEAAPGPISRFTTNPELRPSLKGIFRLVQDSRDALIPLSQTAAAHLIFRSFEWSQLIDNLSQSVLSLAYHTACDIARRVPSYELHFRKSPDFWKLIDEQFPD